MTVSVFEFLRRKLSAKQSNTQNGACSCEFCLMARSMIQKDSNLSRKLQKLSGESKDKQTNCTFSYVNDSICIRQSKPSTSKEWKPAEYKEEYPKDDLEDSEDVLRKLFYVEAELQKCRRQLTTRQTFDDAQKGIRISQVAVLNNIKQLEKKRKELRKQNRELRQRVRTPRRYSSTQSIVQDRKIYKTYPIM